jgi:hypothetical protein
MRAVFVVGLLGACASGSARQTGHDKPDAKPADNVDAPDVPDIDAPMHLADAPDIDSAPHPIDAPSVTVDAPCVPQTTQLLANPTFDGAPMGTGWNQIPVPNAMGGPYYPITNSGPTPQSAPYHALMGGLAGEDCSPAASQITDQIYQDIAIPAGTTQLVLTGYVVIGTMETTTTTVYDTAELALIETNGAPIEVAYSATNLSAANFANGAWQAFSKTFSNPAGVSGRTIRIRATSTNDISYNSNFFFDTLALQATHCP